MFNIFKKNKDKDEEKNDNINEDKNEDINSEDSDENKNEEEKNKNSGEEENQDMTEEEVEADVESADILEDDSSKGFFGRLKAGLSKTRNNFVSKISSIFSRTNIDDDLYEELEETLIQADVGVRTTMELIDKMKAEVEEKEITEPEELYKSFQAEIKRILIADDEELPLATDWEGLKVLMVVGVNGAGKTTTIAKLANRYQDNGKKVLLAAGDTFRAGAIDQLKVWGNRLGVDVIAQSEGADAAAVAYDAVQAAKSRDVDLLIIDTAGRLHTQKNLMDELQKVRRVVGREAGEERVETLLVLDATTGQNALNQADLFNKSVDVDGVALTKLDGTARGGIVIAVRNELGLPVRLIGVGEAADDLQDFKPEDFVEALFTDE
ncbi:signal recognition particle-docking protein FtsY [Halanaerobiaceae bacterium Z-7014]|uniref:Signal recognition particle receptor FtsY n=1 Tax=Halonatronomonas betaini TaxID=2778430 RepID=A0A931AR88_9FIRM|nr:signal recognition particle-docking protein FtsY [Halonatronomonas betaini]MBF8437523.1 signal recognition particle-docking protein FtsY [Halonatronomonas betaini]